MNRSELEWQLYQVKTEPYAERASRLVLMLRTLHESQTAEMAMVIDAVSEVPRTPNGTVGACAPIRVSTINDRSVRNCVQQPLPQVGIAEESFEDYDESGISGSETNVALPLPTDHNHLVMTPEHADLDMHKVDSDEPFGELGASVKNATVDALGANWRITDKNHLDWIQKIVQGARFDGLFCFVIMANAIVLAAELEYDGTNVGKQLNHHGSEITEVFPISPSTFKAVSQVFEWIFAFEVFVKILGLRGQFVIDVWNWFDAAIVACWCVRMAELIIQLDPTTVRLIRIIRMFRLVRLVRLIQGLDALFFLTTSIRKSVPMIGWTIGLLGLILMSIGLLVSNCVHLFVLSGGHGDAYPEDDKYEIFLCFGTFTRTMFTMFELTFANYPIVCRMMSESCSILFLWFGIIHKLIFGFAMLAIMQGVLMQESFKLVSSDNAYMVRQKDGQTRRQEKKLTELFEYADESGDGLLDVNEFRRLMKNSSVKSWLASMEFGSADIDNLFDLIDSNGSGDGRISASEFCWGVNTLKGTAKAIDLATVMGKVDRMQDCLANIETNIVSMLGRVLMPSERSSKVTRNTPPNRLRARIAKRGISVVMD